MPLEIMCDSKTYPTVLGFIVFCEIDVFSIATKTKLQHDNFSENFHHTLNV